MSFRDLAAHIADRFANDIRVERKGKAKRDSSNYMVAEGKPETFMVRGSILSVIDGTGFNDATRVRGFRLQVPITCRFNDFCVGDRLTMLCGPYRGQCFTVSGGNGNAIAQIDASGAFLEIDVVQS